MLGTCPFWLDRSHPDFVVPAIVSHTLRDLISFSQISTSTRFFNGLVQNKVRARCDREALKTNYKCLDLRQLEEDDARYAAQPFSTASDAGMASAQKKNILVCHVDSCICQRAPCGSHVFLVGMQTLIRSCCPTNRFQKPAAAVSIG